MTSAGEQPAGAADTGTWHTVLPSPVGELTVIARDGALIGLFMEQHRRPAWMDLGPRCDERFLEVAQQLQEYFAGERREFVLPLAPVGSEFQRRVWDQLLQIPYGARTTYGELARALGEPGAAQAVGLANGRNPISIIIPCHRVVGSDGSLTGYAGGLEVKRTLLALEEAVPDDAGRLF